MNITEQTAVGDIAGALPSSIRVFQRHGIDFCCGGRTPLGVACQDRGVSFTEVARAITAADEVPVERDWSREPLPLLIDHIIATYHDSLREDLPRLELMAAQVARVHGAKDARLARIEALIRELSVDLRLHMMKEEKVLFPALGVLARNGDSAAAIAAPIAAMEHEHDDAGAMLADLRKLCDDYTPPIWACNTVKALYQGLSELESEMHAHVHLENNILFPRALGQGDARG
jgi:regulator of cell morphogenesis and NO signaling